MRVLVVEDDDEQANLIADILSLAGAANFSFERADDMRHAEHLLRTRAFDIVLLDLMLPDSQGLDTLACIRSASTSTPIVIISAESDEGLAVEAVQAGAQDYLVKGWIDIRLLPRSLRYAVERHRAEKEGDRFFALSLDILGVVDFGGIVQRVNPAVKKILGRDPADLVGRHFLDYLHQEDRAEAIQAFHDFASGIESALFECRCLRSDGSFRWIAWTAVREPSTRLTYFVGRDVTERRRADEVLITALEETRRQAAETAMLLESAQLLLASKDFRNAAREGFNRCKALIGAANGDLVFWKDDGKTAETMLLDWAAEGRPPHFESSGDLAALAADACALGEALFGNDFSAVQSLPPCHIRIQNALCAPLLIRGRAAGLLSLTNKPGGFNSDDTRLAAAFGGIVAVALDNECAIESLAASEEKYRELFNNANDGVVLHELTKDGMPGPFIEVNDVTCRRYGYSREEMLRLSPLDLRVREAHNSVPELMRDMLTRGNLTFETVHVSRTGRRIPVEVSAHVFTLGGRKVVLSVARDISERKQAEESLRRRDQREAAVLQSLPLALYTAEPESFRLTWISEQVQILTGFPSSSFVRDPGLWESRLHNEDRDRVVDSRGDRRCPGSLATEYRWQCADGSFRWFLDQIIVSRDEGGKPKEVIGTWLDITDRKQAEEDLRGSLLRLRRTLEGTVQAMALTVERRDPYTAGHQRRVAQLAHAIAMQMGLSDERAQVVRLAATIHDIGKISVPAEILSRPGPITQVEFRLVKSHPQVGHDILETIDFPWPIADIVLQHHERLDGSGYPAGLTAGEICLEAKILAVADVVEAMASHRPSRPAFSTVSALAEVSQGSGRLYEAAAAQACLAVFEDHFEWS